MAALLAPECLHRGRLRQFSAQYGGWVSIQLVLLSHALVVDPDADVPSAVSVTPRKRRNSLKVWMDLCLVDHISGVRKADGEDAAAVVRRVSHSAGSTAAARGRHVFVVSTAAQEFRFDVASEEEREEWVRCLLLARKLRSVGGGSANGSASAEAATTTDAADAQHAFFRFASSGSEDSDSDEENAPLPPASPSQQHSIRSPRSTSKPSTANSRAAAGPVTLTVLHVVATVLNGASLTAYFPLGAASLEEVSVHRIKVDAIRQLRKQQAEVPAAGDSSVCADTGRQCATLRPEDLEHRSPDWFSLFLEQTGQWLQDEQRCIGSYLSDTAGKRKVTLTLRPTNEMPLPTLRLSISGAKNKVSDLSQCTFTTYTIDVAFNDMTWQLSRRYKEFAALHDQLTEKYNDSPVALPVLPPKHIFTPREGEFVDRRRLHLEQYLHQLLAHPVLSSDVLLMSFLGVVSTSRDPELSQSSMGVLHVTALHNSLNYGDIVLFSCKFGASILQRTFTGSKYDHVGMVVPGASRALPRIIEATSDGIQVFSLKLRLMAYSREVSNSIVVRRFDAERTPALVDELTKFVQRVEGNPYSILGILHSSGESDRTLQNMMSSRSSDGTGEDAKHGTASAATTVASNGTGEDISSNDSSYGGYASSTTSSQSSSPSKAATGSQARKMKKSTRKYFCSSLAASALKQIGWLETTRKSSSFWPGSFENGGEVEGLLAPGVILGPETRVDCRIVEVGLAVPNETQQ